MRDTWTGNGYGREFGGSRRRYFALCNELKIKRDEDAEREFLSVLLGKSFSSRRDLDDADWSKAADHLDAIRKTLQNKEQGL